MVPNVFTGYNIRWKQSLHLKISVTYHFNKAFTINLHGKNVCVSLSWADVECTNYIMSAVCDVINIFVVSEYA